MPTRREFVTTMAGAAAGIYLQTPTTRRQVSVGRTRVKVIDVHCHCVIDVAEIVKGTKLERAGAGRSTSTAISRLPRSDDLTYEVANFIDGVRSVGEIRDAVSAEFEPLDLKAVAEYIELLAKAGAVTFRR